MVIEPPPPLLAPEKCAWNPPLLAAAPDDTTEEYEPAVFAVDTPTRNLPPDEMRSLSVKLPVDDVSNLIIPSSLFVVSSPVSIVILATVVPFQFPLKCTKPCPAPERLLSPIKSAGAADAGCISRSVPLKVKVDSPVSYTHLRAHET